MKTPLNPSDPPFPVRPNEPACQYYLKHGTCKFGQTCKFHHPPLSPKQNATSYGGHSNATSPLLTGVATMLPQRPSEPDCLYFLRNGRCKYGSSCKYHHPIDKKQQKDRSRSAGSIFDLGGSAVTLSSADGATAIPVKIISTNPSHNISQGQAHIILNEGTFTLMMNAASNDATRLNGINPSSSFQSSSNGTQFYLHQSSTSSPAMFPQSPAFSSIPSSYETSSTIDISGRGSLTSSIPLASANTSPALSSLTKYHLSTGQAPLLSHELHVSSSVTGHREDFVSNQHGHYYGSETADDIGRAGIQIARSNAPYSPSRASWMAEGNLSSSAPLWAGNQTRTNIERSLRQQEFETINNDRENGYISASRTLNVNRSAVNDQQNSWGHQRGPNPASYRTEENLHGTWDDGLSNVSFNQRPLFF